MAANGIPSEMQADYTKYFRTSQPGDVQDWAGGTLTRTEQGADYYDPTADKTYNLGMQTPLSEVAGYSPNIAESWKERYGYNYEPQSEPSLFSGIAETPAPAQQAAQTPVTQGYAAPSGASIEDRLTNLLNKDNPFMRRVQTRALQGAEARGLQNSSMAATAGEAAAIDAAYNIASGDANLFSNLYQQERGGEIESSLSAQNAGQQGWLYNLQGDISANLTRLNTDQQLFLQSALKRMDNAQQMEMAAFEANTASGLSAQEASQARINKLFEIDAQNEWEEKFLDKKIALETSQIDAADRDSIRVLTTDIQSDYQRDRLEILLNPNFATPEDRQSALDDLDFITTNRMSNLSQIYSVELTWEPPTQPESQTTETGGGIVIPEAQADAYDEWKSTVSDEDWYSQLSEDQRKEYYLRQLEFGNLGI